MNAQQQAFLQHIAQLIPKLFETIRLGNVKSECVLGERIIGKRQVRLKLVAEVVDSGSNPLATHSQLREVQATSTTSHVMPKRQAAVQPESASADSGNGHSNHGRNKSDGLRTVTNAKTDSSPPRRGPRRRHPLSKKP